MREAGGEVGPGSTAAVLWLMILLVFVPIVAAHLAARYLEGADSGSDPAVVASAPH